MRDLKSEVVIGNARDIHVGHRSCHSLRDVIEHDKTREEKE